MKTINFYKSLWRFPDKTEKDVLKKYNVHNRICQAIKRRESVINFCVDNKDDLKKIYSDLADTGFYYYSSNVDGKLSIILYGWAE